MDALARLPVFFALDGKRAIVAGGGPALPGRWNCSRPRARGSMCMRRRIGRSCRRSRRSRRAGTIAVTRSRLGAKPILPARRSRSAASCDDADAARFAQAARAAGVPVNVIDKPQFCDFAFGAIVNRSPLVIGISTDGAAPVFGQAIRAKFEALIPHGFAAWAEAARRWRDGVKASGLSFGARRRFWQLFTARALGSPNQVPAESDLASLLALTRTQAAAAEAGSVTLVGAGPGDPELLTLKAVRALQSADVILFDALVDRDVLEFARREAKKMLVGKTGYGPSCKQDDINALMVSLAKSGTSRRAAQGRRPADLQPRRRGNRGLPRRRHCG